MLQLDDARLYDLSEAGRLLHRDPSRLVREARRRRIPAARVGAAWGLPVAWVDAAAGLSPADPEALRTWWLARLAPPAPDARRPVRERARLPAADLLEPDEAAERLFATRAALERLALDGTLPALRVDGGVRYDAALVDLVARADEDPALGAEAEARRAAIADWARFEYETVAAPAAAPAGPAPAAAPPAAPAPAAWTIPADLDLGAIEPLPPEPRPPEGTEPARPPSTLIEAEGFETVDD